MKKKRIIALLLAVLSVAWIPLQAVPARAVDMVPGDANGDGALTSDDAIYLLKSVFSPSAYPLPEYLDLDNNNSGTITSDDAIYLLKAVFSLSAYPLKDVLSAETTYSVTFKDWDGTVLKSEKVKEGATATAPANPTRSGYTFDGWDKSYSDILCDTVVTATYLQNSTEKYTVTFFDYDGTTVLKEQEVTSGDYATPPANPTKSGATFMGWSGNYTNVKKSESVVAVYSDQKNVLMASSVSGGAGDTVTVLLSVDGSVKTCGFDLNVTYDSALELLSYDDDMDLDIVVNTDAFENGMKLNFSSASDKTKQRDILELTFKIKDTARSKLPVTIGVNSIYEISGNNPTDSTYAIINGIVSVN